jgi:NAD(P)-dependent dehydrogenase (short-subunit alcohol dehydrogenase family)
MSQPPSWLVVGSSTGMGRAVVERLAGTGRPVLATARRVESIEDLAALPGVHTCRLDVTDQTSVDDALTEALAVLPGLNVVVNAAGVGLVGSVEESTDADLERLVETNFLGTHRLLRSALPHLRRQRSGQVAVITSQGAFQGQAGCAGYCATKAAATVLLEGLAAELAPLGIGVTIVLPGLVATNFHGAIDLTEPEIEDYRETCEPLRRSIGAPYPARAHDVDDVAAALIGALESDCPPLYLALGDDSLSMIRGKLDRVGGELDAWEATSLLGRPLAQ